MTAAGRASVAALALLLGGCGLFADVPEPKPVNAYRSDERDLAHVRRIMVLPFEAAPGVRVQEGELRGAFLGAMANIQKFEVVPLPDGTDDNRQLYEGLRRGRIPAPALVELGKRYRVDGVMLGTITNYRAYTPQQLGLRLQLTSLHSGSTVWAAEGHYDANDAGTQSDLQHFAATFLGEEPSMHDWRINLLSPQKFAAFVSHRLVATLR